MSDVTVYIKNNRINVETVKYIQNAKQVAGRTNFTSRSGFSVPASPYFAERVAFAFRGCDVAFDQEFLDLWNVYNNFNKIDRNIIQNYRNDEGAWPHQRQVTSFALQVPFAMFDVATGAGKSRIAIDLIENLPTKRVLIVGTRKSSSVWPLQFEKHSWSEYEPVMLMAPLTMTERAEQLKIELDKIRRLPLIVVTNYSGLLPEVGNKPNPFANLILNTEWDIVIADESQNIKGWTSAVSLQFDKLRPMAKRRYCMSGTMLPHGPLDAPAQLRFLDPGIFPTIKGFKDDYVKYGGYMNMQVLGYKNQQEFSERLGRVAIHIPKSVLELTEPVRTRIPVKIDKKARRIYDALESELAVALGDGDVTIVNNTLTLRLRLQQLASGVLAVENLESGETHIEYVDDSKKDTLIEVLESIPEDEPIVVFGKFHTDLDQIHEAAKKAGRAAMELSGRRDDLAEWQGKRGGEVLAVQIAAGGVGIDLTRSQYAVYFAMTESYGDLIQTESRLHRPTEWRGREEPVFLYYLVAENTVEIPIYSIVEHKGKVNDLIREYMREKYGTVQ